MKPQMELNSSRGEFSVKSAKVAVVDVKLNKT